MHRTIKAGAVTATAAAMLAVGGGYAVAADGTGGTPRSYQNEIRGAGSTDADSAATAGGRISADAAARGGRSPLPLPLPLPGFGPSSAGAGGSVERYFDAAAGSYEVTFTYVDAVGVERSSGAASASALRTSVATFIDSEGVQSAPAIRFEELPASARTVTSRLLVSVPDGKAGRIWVKADVGATVLASREGATASVDAGTTAIRFTVNRIG